MITLAPFLYPFSTTELRAAARLARKLQRNSSHHTSCIRSSFQPTSHFSTCDRIENAAAVGQSEPTSRLNPTPDDYNITPFIDKCLFTVQAGSGGHGCVSFLREKYVPDGPPNGGDGGSGGNIFIQAVKNCTSLNKLSRRREYLAGKGLSGKGGSCGGKKGDDLLLEVPVGTVVREIKRWDPIRVQMDLERQDALAQGENEEVKQKLAEKWLFYPGLNLKTGLRYDQLPRVPKARKATIAAMEPPGPIKLDLDKHMEKPMLLAAGSLGGYGNPHFLSREHPKPKVATKGDPGMRLALALELKLVADVGLVGLPNAGKSTLLRAISNSRARIGSWAFTTLQPNIGTVILDNYKGRPTHIPRPSEKYGNEVRSRFTIADIPGIIEDAHLNRGLGLDFLRHIERAQILAFVVDLSAGDAVQALNALWREVGEYQALKEEKELAYQKRTVFWDPFQGANDDPFLDGVSYNDVEDLPPLTMPPITAKPWFVVATKADKEGTQDNFLKLRDYVHALSQGQLEHPSRRENAHRQGASAIPISGIRGEGIERIIDTVVPMLD